MRIVAGDATHPALAGAITLAQGHRIVVFDVIVHWGRLPCRRNHQDGECFIQRMAGANVRVCFARFKYANIARLMACHANVVCKVRCKSSRVDDFTVGVNALRVGSVHRHHMRGAWAMTSLAADCQFRKRLTLKSPVGIGNRSWASAVAGDAAREDRSIEAKIRKLVSRRRRPTLGFGIERKGCLKEVFVPLDESPESIQACADYPFDWSSFSKAFSSIGGGTRFTFVQHAVSGIDFKLPTKLLVDIFAGRTRLLGQIRLRYRH